MLKLNLKLKQPKPEEGFTMLEVLVTSLILVGFLLGSLQAITLATLLRVQAQRKTEALSFINQDKTLIEYEALTQPLATPAPNGTYCDPTTLRDRLIALGYKGAKPLSVPTPTTQVVSNVIYGATKDKTTIDTPSTDPNIEFLNKKNYRMARIYTVLPNTLQITWHIWDEGSNVDDNNNPNLGGSGGDADDRSIAILTTEVVPNIGTCP